MFQFAIVCWLQLSEWNFSMVIHSVHYNNKREDATRQFIQLLSVNRLSNIVVAIGIRTILLISFAQNSLLQRFRWRSILRFYFCHLSSFHSFHRNFSSLSSDFICILTRIFSRFFTQIHRFMECQRFFIHLWHKLFSRLLSFYCRRIAMFRAHISKFNNSCILEQIPERRIQQIQL